jgi:hypothetical protein
MNRMVTAKVQGGGVVAADRARLPESTDMQVIAPDDEALTPEVAAALSLRVAEAEGGAFVSAEEVLDGLRGRRRSPVR